MAKNTKGKKAARQPDSKPLKMAAVAEPCNPCATLGSGIPWCEDGVIQVGTPPAFMIAQLFGLTLPTTGDWRLVWRASVTPAKWDLEIIGGNGMAEVAPPPREAVRPDPNFEPPEQPM